MRTSGRNYIVLRRSPDWRTFRIEQTRQFCRGLGVPEDVIIDYAQLWAAQFKIDYLGYRQRMKQIAMRCVEQVVDADVLSHEVVPHTHFGEDDFIYFTDDDDWVHPELFEVLRRQQAAPDGFSWPSIAVASQYDPANDSHRGAVLVRPSVGAVHTNSYAIRAGVLKRLTLPEVLEHYDAHHAAEAGRLNLTQIAEPLSATNKHLCCTTFITREARGAVRPADLRAAMEALERDLSAAELTPETEWLRVPLSAYLAMNKEALGAG